MQAYVIPSCHFLVLWSHGRVSIYELLFTRSCRVLFVRGAGSIVVRNSSLWLSVFTFVDFSLAVSSCLSFFFFLHSLLLPFLLFLLNFR